MLIEICSCGHASDMHYNECILCNYTKRKPCNAFNHKYNGQIGKVTSVYQDNCDDHGLKVFYVSMEFSVTVQSMQIIIGKKRTKSAFGDRLTKAMKKFFETNDFKTIKNKYCYALRDVGDRNGFIKGIASEPILGYKNHNVLITDELL